MDRAASPLRIALLCTPVGNGNLGDESLIAAVIQNIRARVPGADIVAFTSNPGDTRQRHGVTAFPVRPGAPAIPVEPVRPQPASPRAPSSRPAPGEAPGEVSGAASGIKGAIKAVPGLFFGLKLIQGAISGMAGLAGEVAFTVASFARIRGTDLLVVPGSGIVSDHFGGSWNFPYMLLKWTLLAKLAGAKVAYVSVGAGPLVSPLSKRFVKWVLRLADYRSFRDLPSAECIEALGLEGQNPVLPDLAQSHDLDGIGGEIGGEIGSEAGTGDPDRPLVVGVNPFPHFDRRYWPVTDDTRFHEYIDKIAAFVAELLGRGCKVVLFPTQIRSDPLVIEDIRERVLSVLGEDPGERLLMPELRGLGDLLATLYATDIVVATRFHGILLSFLTNRPVVGISNHHKMDQVMTQMGQGAFLLDIDDFDAGVLLERFEALNATRAQAKKEIAARVESCRDALSHQYDRVFGLLN